MSDMSDGPRSGHGEPAEEEGIGGDFGGQQGESAHPGDSGLGYSPAGYTAHMPPPPAWQAPSDHGDRRETPAGPGGWVWDDASGGWRWGTPSSGSRAWGANDPSGDWGWPQGWGQGSGYGDAPVGGWGGASQPPGYAGGSGSGPWDYSGIRSERPPSRRGARILTALLAAALIAAVVGAGLGHAASTSGPVSVAPASGGGSSSGPAFGQPGVGPSNPQPPSGGSPSTGSSGASGGSTGSAVKATPAETEAVGKRVAPELVDINTTLSYLGQEAAGTGIVLTSNGEILTNNHVISGETSIRVTDVGNGKTYNAQVVGYDHPQDIAVLQLIGASGLTTATVGDSSKLAVGQSVVAIGNAGGTGGEPSIAGGSITSLDQSITASDESAGTAEQLNDLIQSNAAIQPGDSGGSLVDLSGHVVGVDTAASDGFSFQTGAQSPEGFSIPINRAMGIVQAIEAGHGSTSVHIGPTAFLGVQVSNVSASSGSGATISSVIANGAAASAGLVAGDTITAVGGRTVSSSTDLADIIEVYRPGQTASVNYVDAGGQRHTVNVTLASGPPS